MTEVTVELANTRSICEAQEWLKSNCSKKYVWAGFDFDYERQSQTGTNRRKVKFEDSKEAFLFKLKWS